MIDAKLYTLLKVSETGNLTRAAEQLSLTQPAVSHHIRQLEAELGVKLFCRVENGLRPTSEGELAVRYARRISAVYENLQRAVRDAARHRTSLSVGVTHTAESNSVVEALANYTACHAEVAIKIITDTIHNLYDKLENYELDLVIAEGGAPDARFCSLLLDTDFLVLVVAPSHPLARKSMVTIDELRRERLILRLPASGTRNLFLAHLESRNLSMDDFNIVLELDNVATIKDLIRREFGVSILAKSACMDELKKGKLAVLPIENLSMTRETNLIYPRDFGQPELLRDLTRVYNETARLYR